jgi:hypothetical protein
MPHVCKSWKVDGIYHLTTIEIAKAQRKTTRSILKRCKTSKLDQRFHLIGNIIVKGCKSIVPASLQIGQSIGITIT